MDQADVIIEKVGKKVNLNKKEPSKTTPKPVSNKYTPAKKVRDSPMNK